jgi:hypothetical protein
MLFDLRQPLLDAAQKRSCLIHLHAGIVGSVDLEVARAPSGSG